MITAKEEDKEGFPYLCVERCDRQGGSDLVRSRIVSRAAGQDTTFGAAVIECLWIQSARQVEIDTAE